MQTHHSHSWPRLVTLPVLTLGVVVTFYTSVFLFPVLSVSYAVAISVAAIREQQGTGRKGLWIVIGSWAWIVLVAPTFGVMPILIAPRLHFRLPLGNTLAIFTGLTLTALYDAVTGANIGAQVDHPFPPLTDVELYMLGAFALISCLAPVWYLLARQRGAVASTPSN